MSPILARCFTAYCQKSEPPGCVRSGFVSARQLRMRVYVHVTGCETSRWAPAAWTATRPACRPTRECGRPCARSLPPAPRTQTRSQQSHFHPHWIPHCPMMQRHSQLEQWRKPWRRKQTAAMAGRPGAGREFELEGLQPEADLRVQPLRQRQILKVPAVDRAAAQNALHVTGIVEWIADHGHSHVCG